MKHRSILRLLVLSIVTLGIYQLLWLKQTRDEMVRKGAKIPPFLMLLSPILAVVGLFALWLMLGVQADAYGDTLSTSADIGIVVASIVAVISIPLVSLYWFYQYCYGVDQVTHGQTSFGISYVLFIVFTLFGVNFIWPFIIQDGFNKVSDNSHKHNHSTKSKHSSQHPHGPSSGPVIYSR